MGHLLSSSSFSSQFDSWSILRLAEARYHSSTSWEREYWRFGNQFLCDLRWEAAAAGLELSWGTWTDSLEHHPLARSQALQEEVVGSRPELLCLQRRCWACVRAIHCCQGLLTIAFTHHCFWQLPQPLSIGVSDYHPGWAGPGKRSQQEPQ